MMRGGNIYDLKRILGHTVKSTMVYAHLDDNSLQGATECLAPAENVELAATGTVSRSSQTFSLVPRLFPIEERA